MRRVRLPQLPDAERKFILEELLALKETSQRKWDKESNDSYNAPEKLPYFDLCRSKIICTLIEDEESSKAYEKLSEYHSLLTEDQFNEAVFYITGFIEGCRRRYKLAKTAA